MHREPIGQSDIFISVELRRNSELRTRHRPRNLPGFLTILKVTINALGRRRSPNRCQVVLLPASYASETEEIFDPQKYVMQAEKQGRVLLFAIGYRP